MREAQIKTIKKHNKLQIVGVGIVSQLGGYLLSLGGVYTYHCRHAAP